MLMTMVIIMLVRVDDGYDSNDDINDRDCSDDENLQMVNMVMAGCCGGHNDHEDNLDSDSYNLDINLRK